VVHFPELLLHFHASSSVFVIFAQDPTSAEQFGVSLVSLLFHSSFSLITFASM